MTLKNLLKKKFDPRDYLTEDEKLKKSLDGLKKYYRLAILTNNNRIQTERTLAALRLNDLFDRVYTYNSFKLLKPNPEFFQKVVEDLNVEPEALLIKLKGLKIFMIY
jgi:HAD superfamily hydrolase (TIGR01509 family)